MDLVQNYGDYSYEYDATHKLVIITESVDNISDDIGFDTDSEAFIETVFVWYIDVKWMQIFHEEEEDAAKKSSYAIDCEKEMELILKKM